MENRLLNGFSCSYGAVEHKLALTDRQDDLVKDKLALTDGQDDLVGFTTTPVNFVHPDVKPRLPHHHGIGFRPKVAPEHRAPVEVPGSFPLSRSHRD